MDFNNKIYDNGCLLLGTKKDIVNFTEDYILKSDDWEKDYFEGLIADLSDLKDTDIVMINYDCSMGYSIDYWSLDNKIEVK